MTEKAYFFTTGGAGDGASTYTQDDLSTALKIVAACMDDEGVASAYLNALATTANGANSVRTATGGAMVDGKPYGNSANVDTAIASAVGGGNTRIDRLVLRCDWAARTVRITRIAGTDAASPTAPAITQTPGTTYDIKLCQVLVNTSGTVTVTDERVFAALGSTNGLGASVVTATNVLDGTLTAAKIADRTRTFFVQALPADSSVTANDQWGVIMQDLASRNAFGNFVVPSDFVSGLTVAAVVVPISSGNLYWNIETDYGAGNEAVTANDDDTALAATALIANEREVLPSVSLSTAAASDYVSVKFFRSGGNALDTLGDLIYCSGFLVSYTADS